MKGNGESPLTFGPPNRIARAMHRYQLQLPQAGGLLLKNHG